MLNVAAHLRQHTLPPVSSLLEVQASLNRKCFSCLIFCLLSSSVCFLMVTCLMLVRPLCMFHSITCDVSWGREIFQFRTQCALKYNVLLVSDKLKIMNVRPIEKSGLQSGIIDLVNTHTHTHTHKQPHGNAKIFQNGEKQETYTSNWHAWFQQTEQHTHTHTHAQVNTHTHKLWNDYWKLHDYWERYGTMRQRSSWHFGGQDDHQETVSSWGTSVGSAGINRTRLCVDSSQSFGFSINIYSSSTTVHLANVESNLSAAAVIFSSLNTSLALTGSQHLCRILLVNLYKNNTPLHFGFKMLCNTRYWDLYQVKYYYFFCNALHYCKK